MSGYFYGRSSEEYEFQAFIAGKMGYEILHAIGTIIALISAFVFYHNGFVHYLFGAIFVYALSMVGSALPLVRVLLWPLLMGIVMFYLLYDPATLMGIMIGNIIPGPVFGVPVGWLYLLLGVIACYAIPQVGVYERTLGLIGAAIVISFIINLLKKR